jgi:phosphocarrier protein HPr
MRRDVEITNFQGLHARPAAEFVRWARRFRAEVKVIKGQEVYSASSIMDLLSANLGCGCKITLEAFGEEEEKALLRLSELLEEFRLREEKEAQHEGAIPKPDYGSKTRGDPKTRGDH